MNNKSQNQRFSQVLKMIMIGDAQVGKTAIVGTYMDNKFDHVSEPTIGLDLKYKQIQINYHENLNIEFWDTTGSETFKSLTRSHYRGANAVLMVYDITNPNSFYSLQNFWLQEVKNHTNEQVQIMVLANKLDLIDDRKISFKEGQDFCRDKELIYREVTATQPLSIQDAILELLYVTIPHYNSIQQNQRKFTINLQNDRQNATSKCEDNSKCSC